MEPLAFPITVLAPFGTAVAQVTDALRHEGFGVLSQIDVTAIFKAKLGVDFRNYLIMGVCNPGLAHQALSANPEAGLFLPCTVTVDEVSPGECLVRIANPEAVLDAASFADGAEVRQVAQQARARLSRAALRLKESVPQP